MFSRDSRWRLGTLATVAVALSLTVAPSTVGAAGQDPAVDVDELLDVYRARLAELEAQLQERSEEARARLEAAVAARRGAVREDAERLAAVQATLQRRLAEGQRRLREVEAAVASRQERGRIRPGVVRVRGGRLFGPEGAADWLLAHAEELELTEEQEERIREVERTHRRAKIERDAAIEVAELDLEELVRDEHSADLDAVEEQMRRIADLRVDDRMARLRLRQQIHAVLTPEQQDKVEEMRPHRMHAMLRPGDGPGVVRFRGLPGERHELRLPQLRERMMERWFDDEDCCRFFFRHRFDDEADGDEEEGDVDGAAERGRSEADAGAVVTL